MSKEEKLPKKKQTRGRQKIPIIKIVDPVARQVTFSKRRLSIFNKAAELSVYCGARVAAIVFSRKGKAFTFGDPGGVGPVLRRFHQSDAEAAASLPPPPPLPSELPPYLEAVGREIEALEEEKEGLAEDKGEDDGNKCGEWEGINVFWWNRGVDEMGRDELVEYMAALEALKAKAVMKASQR